MTRQRKMENNKGNEESGYFGNAREYVSPPSSRNKNRGTIVAIVGGDGSGKTTAIDCLVKSFSENQIISRIHMGIPTLSGITFIVRGLLKTLRLLFRRPFVRNNNEAALYSTSPTFPGYGWLVFQICMAHDRRRAYAKAKQQAKQGYLVICDRFPLPQIKLADGPQIERVTVNHKKNWLIHWLIKLEISYYRQILLPDFIMVLDVDPEVILERKKKIASTENVGQLKACAEEITTAEWGSLPHYIVNANQPMDQVLSDLKSALSAYLEKKSRENRPCIIELVGPPGSGKTTITDILRKKNKDIRAEIFPLINNKKYLPFFALNLLRLSPDILHILLNSKGKQIPTKRDIAIMTILTGWDQLLKKITSSNNQIIILEEGAICLLAKLHGFGGGIFQEPCAQGWWQKTYRKWAHTLGMVIVLDTPAEILLNRIRSRELQYEIKDMPDEDALKYLARIRDSENLAMSNLKNGPAAFHIHTPDKSPDQIAAEIDSILCAGFPGNSIDIEKQAR